jgi:hypothetical protein
MEIRRWKPFRMFGADSRSVGGKVRYLSDWLKASKDVGEDRGCPEG